MNNISDNFSSKDLNKYCKGGCEVVESNNHIYYCEKWNKTQNNTKYEEIYHGRLEQLIKVFYIMKENMLRREIFTE